VDGVVSLGLIGEELRVSWRRFVKKGCEVMRMGKDREEEREGIFEG
jgi:hypothetical protein